MNKVACANKKTENRKENKYPVNRQLNSQHYGSDDNGWMTILKSWTSCLFFILDGSGKNNQ